MLLTQIFVFPSSFIRRKTYFLFFIFTWFIFQITTAQYNTVDSLKTQIKLLKSKPEFSTKDTIYINLLNSLGQSIRFYKTDSLYLLSKEALENSNLASHALGKINAFIGLGDYYSDKGDHTESILNYKQALLISKKENNSELILASRNKMSNEYDLKGDYAHALSGYLENIELAKQTNNLFFLSVTNENIAFLYISQKDHTKALEFLKKAKKMNEKMSYKIHSAQTICNLASLYSEMGEVDLAMFNLNSSIKVFEANEVFDWLAYAFEIKGNIYLQKQKPNWALNWYKQGEMLQKKLEDDRGKINLFNGMAEAYLELKKEDLSHIYALKAYEISKKINFKKGIQKCAKTLYRLGKNKKDYEAALYYHEIYKQTTDSLSRSENEKSLILLKTKMAHDQREKKLISENERALTQQKNYIYLSIAILIIFLAFIIMIKRNEKLQKDFNTKLKAKTIKLEKSEMQLKESNQTKDKLFSIIGHDLRGPIGSFQNLLELFMEGEINQKDFIGFTSNLKHDINHIYNTLNNLLLWGQTQMNGSITNPSKLNLQTIIEENIHLLSETANNKSIKIKSLISLSILVWCDQNQIGVVIRNLISNALKFTPENGTVTISSIEKTDYWQISVSDNGVGMNKETLEKLFKKDTNITTYGTNNESGTGLGLSLCKEMIEKNNGKIWVDSIEGFGSTFYFTVPKPKKNDEMA